MERERLDVLENEGEPRAGNRKAIAWTVAFAVILGLLFLVDGPVYQFLHKHYNVYTRPVPSHMKVVTRILRSMEDWGENVYIACVLFAMWRMDKHRRSRVPCLILAAILVSIPVEAVKRVTGRERPEVSQGATIWRGPEVWREGGDVQSFPSGHTASAASYSGSLAAFYPPLRPVCVALAVGCAGNRIWKERHFLSDCWAGGVFGFWFAATLPRRRWMKPLLRWFDDRFSVPPPDGQSTADNAPLARAA
ncbi:MAG: phosphatase PAP2 family protein [Planctomycetota bacterium]